MTFQSDQDDVGAGKLGDLENFRSQWQRELNEKNKEEIGEKQVTNENSEDDDEAWAEVAGIEGANAGPCLNSSSPPCPPLHTYSSPHPSTPSAHPLHTLSTPS